MDVSGRSLVEHLPPGPGETKDSHGMEPSSPHIPMEIPEQPASFFHVDLPAQSGPAPRRPHLLSHSATAGSPASTAWRTSRTFSSSQLMMLGSFHRKWDRPRYRLTSWLSAGGWLREGRACKHIPPPRSSLQAPAGTCWAQPGCAQSPSERRLPRRLPTWGMPHAHF